MNNNNVFKIVVLLARPAAGKSEIIKYLKSVPVEERIQRFHIGHLVEIDDFPMLWTWFEEDALLNKMGQAPIHTDQEGYFLHQYFWDLLIERINLEYSKKMRDIPLGDEELTVFVEFSRGVEHGGYRSAFAHLSKDLLEKMVVFYVDVSWEESLRKNRARFNPAKPDSILEHGIPDQKLERLYKETDWEEVSAGDGKYITFNGYRVPFIVFKNEDDITSHPGEALNRRLEDKLLELWGLNQAK